CARKAEQHAVEHDVEALRVIEQVMYGAVGLVESEAELRGDSGGDAHQDLTAAAGGERVGVSLLAAAIAARDQAQRQLLAAPFDRGGDLLLVKEGIIVAAEVLVLRLLAVRKKQRHERL